MIKRFWLALEAALYGAYLIGDIAGVPVDGLKYAAVALCAAMAVEIGEPLTMGALLCSLVADLFLLFDTRHVLLGVLAFGGGANVICAVAAGWNGYKSAAV